MSREEDLREIVQRHGTWSVWHYTLAEYLPSIFQEGAILPRSELERREVVFPDEHYWGSPGKENEMRDFVCCSFLPSWGMMTSETSDLVLIGLDRSVIWSLPCRFCPGNAARNEFPAEGIKQWGDPEHLEKLYVNPDRYVTVAQAEILIEGGVPLTYFREMVFWDQESRDSTVKALESVLAETDFSHPVPERLPANVNPSRFPRDWQPERVQWQ